MNNKQFSFLIRLNLYIMAYSNKYLMSFKDYYLVKSVTNTFEYGGLSKLTNNLL